MSNLVVDCSGIANNGRPIDRVTRIETAVEYLCLCLRKRGVDSRDMEAMRLFIRGEADEPPT